MQNFGFLCWIDNILILIAKRLFNQQLVGHIHRAYNVLSKQAVNRVIFRIITHSICFMYLMGKGVFTLLCVEITFAPDDVYGSCLFYVWKQCQPQRTYMDGGMDFIIILENWFSCGILYLNDFKGFMMCVRKIHSCDRIIDFIDS